MVMPDLDAARVWENVYSLLIATMCGLARVLYEKKRTLKLIKVLSDLFVAAITGYMFLSFARTQGITADWVGVVSGVGGLGGPLLLFAVAKRVAKNFGFDLEEELKNAK